jgi:hypothetical protein
MSVLARSSALALGAALVLAGGAAAQPPPTQEVVLPGPVPYPTVSPPLVGFGPAPPGFTRYVFHITSDQRVRVGVDEEGRPTAVRVRERLGVSGRGDYQFAITGPISDVRRAPGSESEPGLRVNQVLWAGFSPGRKVLAADVTLRPRAAAQFLPVRLQLRREANGVTLTVVNATRTPVLEYVGFVRPQESAALLDQTRRAALAGVRLTPAHATFIGSVSELTPRPSLEAPIRVEGELGFPGARPVPFFATLGDGRPLRIRVHAEGSGRAHVRVRAWPVPVERLLRPPGASTWQAAVRRRQIPAASLLQRLLEARIRLVRVDQYETFLSNPDADGRNRIVYEYETAAVRSRAVAPPASERDSGGGPLVVLLVLGASVLGAGAALVAWAHS